MDDEMWQTAAKESAVREPEVDLPAADEWLRKLVCLQMCGEERETALVVMVNRVWGRMAFRRVCATGIRESGLYARLVKQVLCEWGADCFFVAHSHRRRAFVPSLHDVVITHAVTDMAAALPGMLFLGHYITDGVTIARVLA